MSKVITFSRNFPAYHPRRGKPTYFVEKVLNSLKINYPDYFQLLLELNQKNTQLGKLSIEDINKFYNSLNFNISEVKNHTIRGMDPRIPRKKEYKNRFKVGDKFSPRCWSGIPYDSPQIIFLPDTKIPKVWDFEINGTKFYINGKLQEHVHYSQFHDFVQALAQNDGFGVEGSDDLLDWFKFPCEFKGQIICWNDKIEY